MSEIDDARRIAARTLAKNEAFCPSCFLAGLRNCAYFDECGFEDEQRRYAVEAKRLQNDRASECTK